MPSDTVTGRLDFPTNSDNWGGYRGPEFLVGQSLKQTKNVGTRWKTRWENWVSLKAEVPNPGCLWVYPCALQGSRAQTTVTSTLQFLPTHWSCWRNMEWCNVAERTTWKGPAVEETKVLQIITPITADCQKSNVSPCRTRIISIGGEWQSHWRANRWWLCRRWKRQLWVKPSDISHCQSGVLMYCCWSWLFQSDIVEIRAVKLQHRRGSLFLPAASNGLGWCVWIFYQIYFQKSWYY